MTPSDKKILKQALASLPSSRRASLESVLVEDADPSSDNQNKPESYYGLEPKGVQAMEDHKILKQALASLPVSRRAAFEEILLADSEPASKDQNKPESYYGLAPKGIQAKSVK